MRSILVLVVLVALTIGNRSFAGTLEVHSSRVSKVVVLKNAIGPGPLDFKKQELPKKIPQVVERYSVPNLGPLIEQLIRHSELDYSATKLMPWVYSTGTESIVADYEAAVASLELADDCLFEAMQNSLLKSNDSLKTDPAIVEARLTIDAAEYTILFLLELAILEL